MVLHPGIGLTIYHPFELLDFDYESHSKSSDQFDSIKNARLNILTELAALSISRPTDICISKESFEATSQPPELRAKVKPSKGFKKK